MRVSPTPMLAFALFSAGVAHALPGYVSLVPTNNSCSTCHNNPDGGGARNAFGQQFESFPFFDRRWTTLCSLDADGDGFTNGEELGDPECAWQLLTPPPEGLSSPSDPESLPDETLLPTRDEDTSVDGLGDDSRDNDDSENDDDGLIPVGQPMPGSNGQDSSDSFGSEGSTNDEPPQESQLIPVDTSPSGGQASSIRPPLASGDSMEVLTEGNADSDQASSGCSIYPDAENKQNVLWLLGIALFARIRRSTRRPAV